jgi:hypothetical protein
VVCNWGVKSSGVLPVIFHPIWVKLEKSGTLDDIKEIRFLKKIGFLAFT